MKSSTNPLWSGAILLRACLMAFIGLTVTLNLHAIEKGAIPPPPPFSGVSSWDENLRTIDAEIIVEIPSRINLPSAFNKEVWGGWFANHAMAMISEPAIYAEYDHESWLRVVTACGVLGLGNFYDPLIDLSHKKVSERIEAIIAPVKEDQDKKREEMWKSIRKETPFWLFANIPQIELLKDEANQDIFFREFKSRFDLLIRFMPKTHREGYLELGKGVYDVITQPGWYERELAYYQQATEQEQKHLFTKFNPDGKPNPFRKGIAFVFRRVNDGTVTVERATVLLKRFIDMFSEINVSKRDRSGVHDPKAKEDTPPSKEDFFLELKSESVR